jgi:hypothetical protein
MAGAVLPACGFAASFALEAESEAESESESEDPELEVLSGSTGREVAVKEPPRGTKSA